MENFFGRRNNDYILYIIFYIFLAMFFVKFYVNISIMYIFVAFLAQYYYVLTPFAAMQNEYVRLVSCVHAFGNLEFGNQASDWILKSISIRPTLCQSCCMGVKRGPLRNTCAPAWMRLICGRYARF